MTKFEDKIDVIDEELKKRRSKWHLDAVAYMDYSDVEQIIRIHIYNQWHLWDQSRPIEPWLNRVISNQISNLLRNNYGVYSRPCLKCSANQGGDLCALYEKQCEACPLFAKWVEKKKAAHDIKLALPLENHFEEAENINEGFVDYEAKIDWLQSRIQANLTDKKYKIYKMMYVERSSDEDIAKFFGYKKSNKKRYKQLENLRKEFYSLAQKILKEEDYVEI